MASEKLLSAVLNSYFDVYNILSNKTDNIFLSPLSISTVLAMTSLGAKDKTLEQLRKVLHLHDISEQSFHEYFGNTLREIDKRSQAYTLRIANQLFIQTDFPISPDYLQSSKTFYDGGITGKDFSANTESSRLDINGWVEQQTQNKIKDLLQPGTIDESTRLVLVNAVYFKGNWMDQFEAKCTMKKLFHMTSAESKEIDMMCRTGDYKFHHSLDYKCKIISLPYVAGHLSMYLILPLAVDGLAELESQLSAEMLQNMLNLMFIREVIVEIPKFKLETQYSLKEKLMELGLVELFTSNANLSGISGKPGELCVGAIEHKAFLEVNEEGSEAAAATFATIMLCCAMIGPDIEFKADHPFLFFIRDNVSGIILFMGSLRKPC